MGHQLEFDDLFHHEPPYEPYIISPVYRKIGIFGKNRRKLLPRARGVMGLLGT